MAEPSLIQEILMIVVILSPIILSVILLRLIWSGDSNQENFSPLSQISHDPCGHCIYFTGSHHLTCTVHPHTALTTEAINCSDFQPAVSLQLSASKCSEYPEY